MKISKEKIEKIQEQIVSLLFQIYPKSLFTSQIAHELARDEEFIKNLLKDLRDKKIVVSIFKNSKGKLYSKRIRWRLSNEAYNKYKILQ